MGKRVPSRTKAIVASVLAVIAVAIIVVILSLLHYKHKVKKCDFRKTVRKHDGTGESWAESDSISRRSVTSLHVELSPDYATVLNENKSGLNPSPVKPAVGPYDDVEITSNGKINCHDDGLTKAPNDTESSTNTMSIQQTRLTQPTDLSALYGTVDKTGKSAHQPNKTTNSVTSSNRQLNVDQFPFADDKPNNTRSRPNSIVEGAIMKRYEIDIDGPKLSESNVPNKHTVERPNEPNTSKDVGVQNMEIDSENVDKVTEKNHPDSKEALQEGDKNMVGEIDVKRNEEKDASITVKNMQGGLSNISIDNDDTKSKDTGGSINGVGQSYGIKE